MIENQESKQINNNQKIYINLGKIEIKQKQPE